MAKTPAVDIENIFEQDNSIPLQLQIKVVRQKNILKQLNVFKTKEKRFLKTQKNWFTSFRWYYNCRFGILIGTNSCSWYRYKSGNKRGILIQNISSRQSEKVIYVNGIGCYTHCPLSDRSR